MIAAKETAVAEYEKMTKENEITKAAKETRCTTLAVIHQPRFETLLLFDRVVFLAAGGRLVYS